MSRCYSNENCWYLDVCSEDCTLCNRYLEIKTLMENSGVPESLHYPIQLYPKECDLPAFKRLREIKDNILDFVTNGENLFICSQHTGNGKTSWAIKLMYKYFSCIWAGNGLKTRALLVYVPEFLLKLKDFNNPVSQSYKNLIANVDLVIWDDVGTGNLTMYDYTQLLTYIHQRQFSGKANIYTSNITNKADLDKYLGAKLASRIWNTSEIIEFKGNDSRR